VSKPPAEQMCV